MKWEVVLITLIPLAVLILAAIFRGLEESKEKDKDRAKPDDGSRLRVPKRPPTELDRFLNEARQRKDAGTRRPPPKRQPEPLPIALPLEPPPPRPRKPEPPPRPVAPAPPPPPPVVVEPPRLPVPRPRRPASPMLTQLSGLLRDKNSLATAFVLREIFDRPVGQRRPS